MKIKILKGLAGPKFVYNPGDVVEMEDKQAIRLCKAGIAQPIKEQKTETAVKPPGENAAIKYPVHKGGGWYELSNGETVKGKEEALEAQKALDGGGKK